MRELSRQAPLPSTCFPPNYDTTNRAAKVLHATLAELRVEMTESAKRKITNPLRKVLPCPMAPDVHPAVRHIVKAGQIVREHGV